MQSAMRIAHAALLACVAAIAAWTPAQAQNEPTALERRVKSAFLYRFAGYIEWPQGTFPSADAPLTIGVMGDELIAAETAQLVAGRTIDGRPLAVRRIALAEQAVGVHILFVGGAESSRLAQLVKALPPGPMLIVSESAGPFRQGSVITFVLVDGRVRFDVSLEAAERRRIRLSSRLLAVAKSVQGGPQ